MRQIQIQHTTYKYNIQVEIDGAKTCQIQIAQSVPIASPLTWNLVGDPGQTNDNDDKVNDNCFTSYLESSKSREFLLTLNQRLVQW